VDFKAVPSAWLSPATTAFRAVPLRYAKKHAAMDDVQPAILAHYAAAGPLLERHFGGIPVVPVAPPRGDGGTATYGASLDGVAPGVATILVPTLRGSSPYVRLTDAGIAWLVACRGAVGFDAWTPLRNDPARAAYGRIRLAPHGRADDALVVTAARLVRERLAAEGMRAFPMLEGFRGMTLWLPGQIAAALRQAEIAAPVARRSLPHLNKPSIHLGDFGACGRLDGLRRRMNGGSCASREAIVKQGKIRRLRLATHDYFTNRELPAASRFRRRDGKSHAFAIRSSFTERVTSGATTRLREIWIVRFRRCRGFGESLRVVRSHSTQAQKRVG